MSTSTTVTADKFFFALLNSTNKLIDVFLEDWYNPVLAINQRFLYHSHTESINTISFMLDAIKTLSTKHCVIDDKNSGACVQYKNHVRFHLADIRGTYSDFIQYIQATGWIFSYLNMHWGAKRDLDNSIHEFYQLGNTGKFNDPNTVKKLALESLTSTKIAKQMSNIPDKYREVKDILNNQLNYAIDNLIPNILYPKLYPVISEAVSRNKPIKSDLSAVWNLCLMMMDTYLASRMFRTFKNVPGRLGGEPQNIVIYVGNAHGNNYRKLLSQLGFTMEFNAANRGAGQVACMDVRGLEVKWI
jgi:hypothetical protein